MSRRRTHRKSHRRRRVGAMNPDSTVMKVAALAGGYLFGDQINSAIDSIVSKVSPAPAAAATGALPAGTTGTLVLAGEIGLGGMLLLKGRRTLPKTIAGGLLAGAGIKRALKQFGMISGYQSVPVLAGAGIRGYQNVPVLGGIPAQLQGVPAQLQGYGTRGSGVNGYNTAQKIMGGIGNTGSGYRNSGANDSGYTDR